jgi:hypothetical protein
VGSPQQSVPDRSGRVILDGLLEVKIQTAAPGRRHDPDRVSRGSMTKQLRYHLLALIGIRQTARPVEDHTLQRISRERILEHIRPSRALPIFRISYHNHSHRSFTSCPEFAGVSRTPFQIA